MKPPGGGGRNADKISMTIRKAVIPAAGFGTRMLPAAKAVPKEMLPVLDRPVIQYVVEEAAGAGIDDVLMVVSRGKEALEDHFDRAPELENRLKEGKKTSLLASIDKLVASVKVHSVRQPSQRGLGDAVLQARRHVGGEPFLCMLGDTIFSGDAPARQLVEAFGELNSSIIGLEEVPPEKVSRYGIVGGKPVREGVIRIDTLVEKPDAQSAPSRLAIAARYVLTPGIFQALDETTPGKGGEIQLTDAIRILASREPVYGVVLRGTRHDVGNPIDWLRTNLLFASREPETWRALAPTIDQLSRR
jgi:UTP--glucose-1-phosphate uridylyltransferase